MFHEAIYDSDDYETIDSCGLSPSDFMELRRAYMQAIAMIEKAHSVDDSIRLGVASNILKMALDDLPRSVEGSVNATAVAERSVLHVLLGMTSSTTH